MKKKIKYHTVGTIPKYSPTVIETECKLIPLAHIYLPKMSIFPYSVSSNIIGDFLSIVTKL